MKRSEILRLIADAVHRVVPEAQAIVYGSEAFIEAVEELAKRFPKQKAYDNNEIE